MSSATLQICELDKNDNARITQIAQWYEDEWQSPKERTIQRLSSQPNEYLLCQLLLVQEDELLGSGALCHDPNILKVYPNLSAYGPWIAMLVTAKSKRGRGLGAFLLQALENKAIELGFSTLYLYTFTAESLYKRAGWTTFMTVDYKQHSTVVMKKELT